jgi:hypothetical protein|nr:MAG TPA: hypothetical protein [Caudoviricetes sp.]
MYDLSYPISPNKALTKEGFLICRNAVIASIGAREYAISETNEVKPNAEGKVFIMRPSDVLFSDDTINSLEGKPVTLGHPPVDSVTGDNWKQYAVGSISHVRKGEGQTAGCLVADLMIFEPKAIEAVFNGIAKELSCGFKSNVIDQGGGIGIETNFIGNHVALVPQGKGGATCSLKDSVITKEDTDMAFFKKDAAPADVNAQILQQLQAMSERLAALEKSAQVQSPAPATNADEAKQPETNEAQTQTPAPENKAAETPAPKPDEKKADDDMPPVAPNPLAGIDPAVLGAAILQALTDAKADKKADEKPDDKADACKKDAKPQTKLDAAMIRDAADIAPSLAPTTPNLPYAAILEFAKSQQGKSFVDSFGDLSKCDHAMVLRACANFKRSMTQATLATVKHDEAPKKAKSFVEQSAELWNKAK